jgi:two-component system, chemotaxis family, protein-glutamate methylesterase/glutaminase
MKKKIKVLIVDDSALVRQTLSGIFNLDPDIEVTGTAADPIFAAKKITRERPDVITLDLEMPRMNGLTFLKKLMAVNPIPVVVISGLSGEASKISLKALEYGAVEVLAKPEVASRDSYMDSAITLCDAIKAAAQVNMDQYGQLRRSMEILPRFASDPLSAYPNQLLPPSEEKLIAIGASTGGVHALEVFLKKMPADCPGIVIVQHMPEVFTKSFADRLNALCEITVKEGVHGDMITPGKAIIAPGNRHMMINRKGDKYIIAIHDGPLVNRHRPSVDVLFRSVAKEAGAQAKGIILTGMGDDGAAGLLEMKKAGAYTVAQDEASCVVFGMPRVAIGIGAADAVLPLDKIAGHVCRTCKMA